MNPNYATTHFRAEPFSDWPRSFAIITACNPYHPERHTGSDDENTHLDALLEAHLRELEYRHWRVIGGSPDFVHAEPGFAVEVSLPEGIELGRKFNQEAIFWIEGDDLYLVACQGSERQPLGSWRERLSHNNAVTLIEKPKRGTYL